MFLTNISPIYHQIEFGKTLKIQTPPPHFRENALKAHFLLEVIFALEITFAPKLHFVLKVQEEPAKRTS